MAFGHKVEECLRRAHELGIMSMHGDQIDEHSGPSEVSNPERNEREFCRPMCLAAVFLMLKVASRMG